MRTLGKVVEVLALVAVAGICALLATGIHYRTYSACEGGFGGYAFGLTYLVDPLIGGVALGAALITGRAYARRASSTHARVLALRLGTIASVAVVGWLALTIWHYPYNDGVGPGPCPAWLVK